MVGPEDPVADLPRLKNRNVKHGTWQPRTCLFPLIQAEQSSNNDRSRLWSEFWHITGEEIVWTNTYTGQQWYAGGPSRPELQAIAVAAFREFGVSTYLDPNPRPPLGDLGPFYQFVPGVATSDFDHYFHTDAETPETVPWTGLEASTRAYARIIDEVNKLELAVRERP